MSNNGWRTVKLGDVAQIILGGTPKTKEPAYWGGEIPWASVVDFDVPKYIYHTEKTITERGLNESNTKLLDINDIIISARGSVGKMVVCGRPVAFNQSCYALRTKGNNLEQNYLYYLLKYYVNHLKKVATGGVFDTIVTDTLKNLEIKLPPFDSQVFMGAILSQYDNLIQNNIGRINSLEESAKRLYREWFVKFRFPGHENVPMVDSELGPIPEGWDVVKINDAFDITGGGTPSTKTVEYWNEGNINWYSPKDLTAAKSVFMSKSGKQITELGLKKSSARLFPKYSVMMTSRATIGVISINSTEACTNQGFITCIPNGKFSMYHVYHWLTENVDAFHNISTGATFKELIKTNFKKMDILLPDEETRTKFVGISKSVFSEIEKIETKQQQLRAARDLLLPKLISGQLDVSELDIATEEMVTA